MPTIHRFDGLRVTIYPNDHRPAHVHVIGADAEAVFNLHCPEGPAKVRESFGFTRRALRNIEAALDRVIHSLCVAWERIHGPV